MRKSTSILFTSSRPVYIVQSGTSLRPFTSFHVPPFLPQAMNKMSGTWNRTSGTWKDVSTSRKVTLRSRVKAWLVYIRDVRTWFFVYTCRGLRKEAST